MTAEIKHQLMAGNSPDNQYDVVDEMEQDQKAG